MAVTKLPQTTDDWTGKVMTLLGLAREEAGSGTSGQDPAIAKLRAALTKQAVAADAIMATAPGRADEIRAGLSQIEELLDAGDAVAAREAIFDLAALLKSIKSAAAEIEELEGLSSVSIALAAHDWRSAASRVSAQVRSVRDAVLAEIEDEAAAAQAAKLDRLAAAIADRGAALDDAINAIFEVADPSDRAARAAAAGELASAYLALVAGNPLLMHLIGTPLDGGDEPEHEALLVGPLTALRAELAKAAS